LTKTDYVSSAELNTNLFFAGSFILLYAKNFLGALQSGGNLVQGCW